MGSTSRQGFKQPNLLIPPKIDKISREFHPYGQKVEFMKHFLLMRPSSRKDAIRIELERELRGGKRDYCVDG
jgi:hypothetical protein